MLFMTRSEVKSLLRKEKDKASAYMNCLYLKLSYHAAVVAKPYLVPYRRGITREHVVHFIGSIGRTVVGSLLMWKIRNTWSTTQCKITIKFQNIQEILNEIAILQ